MRRFDVYFSLSFFNVSRSSVRVSISPLTSDDAVVIILKAVSSNKRIALCKFCAFLISNVRIGLGSCGSAAWALSSFGSVTLGLISLVATFFSATLIFSSISFVCLVNLLLIKLSILAIN